MPPALTCSCSRGLTSSRSPSGAICRAGGGGPCTFRIKLPLPKPLAQVPAGRDRPGRCCSAASLAGLCEPSRRRAAEPAGLLLPGALASQNAPRRPWKRPGLLPEPSAPLPHAAAAAAAAAQAAGGLQSTRTAAAGWSQEKRPGACAPRSRNFRPASYCPAGAQLPQVLLHTLTVPILSAAAAQ